MYRVDQTAPILLDSGVESKILGEIREKLESSTVKVSDLHVWRISGNHHAAMVSLVTSTDKDAEFYKDKLKDIESISHLTVEVNYLRYSLK